MILTLGSCISDNRSNCSDGPAFRFSYKYKQKGDKNEFPTVLKGLRLYIFDKNNLFIKMVRYDLPSGTEQHSFTLDCDLPVGVYNIVTLAGERQPFYRYVKEENGQLKDVDFTPGKTTLDEVLFMLGNNSESADKVQGNDIIASNSYLDLYHNLKRNVTITPETQEIPVNLTEITHDIAITVNDQRTNPDINQLDLRGSLFNNLIDFKRQIYDNADKVRYLPYETTDGKQKNTRTFTLSSMPMTVDMLGDLVLDEKDENKELFRKSLMGDIIAQYPKIKENPALLDQISQFNVGLDLTDSGIDVYVQIMDWDKVYVIHTDFN